jgi:flavin reductase (DIM6/NTAB) family NADH-FMN oxidoreductase RutF
MPVAVPLPLAHRLLNHGPTTLVATADGDRTNVMAAAWVMPLDFDPPKLAAVVAADTFTRELLTRSGECVVSLPTTEQVDLCYALGTTGGRDLDKVAAFELRFTPGAVVRAPRLDGCAAWLECRVVREPELAERYDLFVLEVVAAWADETLWNGKEWRFAPGGPRTIHHLKGGLFFATGEPLAAQRDPRGAPQSPPIGN